MSDEKYKELIKYVAIKSLIVKIIYDEARNTI